MSVHDRMRPEEQAGRGEARAASPRPEKSAAGLPWPGDLSLHCAAVREQAERIFSWTAFPVFLGGSLLAGMTLLEQGVAPSTVVLAVVLVVYALVAALERVFPYERTWLHPQQDLGADVGLAATNGALNALLEPLVLAGAVFGATALSAFLGGDLWPERWPLLAQLALALVIAELVEYSVHRAMHEVPWLWPLHAPHHSAPRLYWLNALRFHPIDLALVGPAKLLPLALLGASGPVFTLVTIFSAVHGTFQHANLVLRLGPLNWIFSMAELHRWHHSKRVAESNHNYGGNLILWDIVFGTRWLPKDRKPPREIGLEAMAGFPTSFLGLLLVPFRWRRIVGTAVARRDDAA